MAVGLGEGHEQDAAPRGGGAEAQLQGTGRPLAFRSDQLSLRSRMHLPGA